VVKVLHLFIETPRLRNLGEVGVDFFAENFALNTDDLFRQIPADRIAAVVLGTQPQGDDALEIFVASDAFAPELLKHGLLVGVVVIPATELFPRTAIPFLLRS